MLACMDVPAIHGIGNSRASAERPKIRLRSWSIGTGFTRPLSETVSQSKRSLGKKKACNAAHV